MHSTSILWYADILPTKERTWTKLCCHYYCCFHPTLYSTGACVMCKRLWSQHCGQLRCISSHPWFIMACVDKRLHLHSTNGLKWDTVPNKTLPSCNRMENTTKDVAHHIMACVHNVLLAWKHLHSTRVPNETVSSPSQYHGCAKCFSRDGNVWWVVWTCPESDYR